MSPTRRQVLVGLSGATLAYALQVGCAPVENDPEESPEPRFAPPRPGGRPDQPGIDAREWLVIGDDGSVTAFTARTEIGQGLTTVLHDLIEQAMELPPERVEVVMGDTDRCPSDGPTTGSAATRFVAWAFWVACHEVKADLRAVVAERHGRVPADLEYRAGEIVSVRGEPLRVGIGELADDDVRSVDVDAAGVEVPPYVDRGSPNVNGEAIVTGTLRYTADDDPDGCVYGAIVPPGFHQSTTRLRIAHVAAARRLPGVTRVKEVEGQVYALGETYTAARRAIDAIESKWEVPTRPAELDLEREIRDGARQRRLVEERGDAAEALARADMVVRETYSTQFASQVPLETDTALAQVEDGRVRVDLGTQNPFLVRHRLAAQKGVSPEEVRVVARPAGGAFGAKSNHTVGLEAVRLMDLAEGPVKYIYSRTDDIQKRGRYKEAVIIDVASGLTSDGRLLARQIDIFQDEGYGSEELYDIPAVRTRLFATPLPARHGTMRGTSYAQTVFAIESHTDSLATRLGVDPLEFRRQHAALPAMRPLIDACAEMIGYAGAVADEESATGFAMINHGDRQLGVVGAEISLDRRRNAIRVERLAGAFDVGLVINRRLAENGIKSAMIWGLGYALFEEVRLDGHRCHTTGFADYRIARMSDTPPIRLAFFDNQRPGRPRGCGEMPLPATTAAIANAASAATGARFFRLPLTPERVRETLSG